MGEIEKPSMAAAVTQVAANLIPVVGGAFAAALGYAQELDRWRAQQMAEAARDAAGEQDDEQLLRRITADDRLVDLIAIAVDGARRSAWEAKRVTMGRVLGSALTDDADIDDSAAMLAALAVFEAPHFRYLETLASEPPPPPPLVEMPILEPYRSQLVAHGAVELGASGTWEPHLRVSGVTEFGSRLLDWIRSAEGGIVDDGRT